MAPRERERDMAEMRNSRQRGCFLPPRPSCHKNIVNPVSYLKSQLLARFQKSEPPNLQFLKAVPAVPQSSDFYDESTES